MNELEFSIDIKATREKVWDVLWRDDTFRGWASIIDPGTYMVGDLQQGNEVQFISAENGYGVTSLVQAIIPNEHLVLLHQVDTQSTGKQERDKEWTGGKEEYILTENNSVTTLKTVFDVPRDLEAYFKAAYPKALQLIKEMAETSTT